MIETKIITMIRIKLFLVIIKKKYISIKVILVTELKDMRGGGCSTNSTVSFENFRT